MCQRLHAPGVLGRSHGPWGRWRSSVLLLLLLSLLVVLGHALLLGPLACCTDGLRGGRAPGGARRAAPLLRSELPEGAGPASERARRQRPLRLLAHVLEVHTVRLKLEQGTARHMRANGV